MLPGLLRALLSHKRAWSRSSINTHHLTGVPRAADDLQSRGEVEKYSYPLSVQRTVAAASSEASAVTGETRSRDEITHTKHSPRQDRLCSTVFTLVIFKLAKQNLEISSV